MPHAVRPVARLLPLLALLPATAGLLTACPAPAPRPDAAARGEPPRAVPSATAEPAAPGEPATPRTEVEPAVGSAPAPTPAADPAPPHAPGIPLPPELAAEGVRPVVQSLWRALEAVDAGDADAMAQAMTADGRWFPPGGLEESAQGPDDLRRAMGPWGSDAVTVDVRRVIDLGGSPFIAQVSIGNREQPTFHYELALLVEVEGDRIAAVHHFGDPLGPVRVGPSEQEPLDLGPVAAVALEGGPPEVAHVDATRQLVAALDGREHDAVRALLAEDVVLHDVVARRTRRGRDGYLEGWRATLGPTGHVAVIRHYAGRRFVAMEGAIHGRDAEGKPQAAEGEPQEHGFADIHRLADGKIVETWHYLNRRGRPHRPRIGP
jgi:ketosteroid isomerase-like protein